EPAPSRAAAEREGPKARSNPARCQPSRRGLVAGGGAWTGSLALGSRGFAQGAPAATQAKPAPLPGSLKTTPMLDAWIRINADGSVTVFTGKSELGQGIKTALIQVAAEQLSVPAESITLVTCDTHRTPNEQYTSGSQSMQDSGTVI